MNTRTTPGHQLHEANFRDPPKTFSDGQRPARTELKTYDEHHLPDGHTKGQVRRVLILDSQWHPKMMYDADTWWNWGTPEDRIRSLVDHKMKQAYLHSSGCHCEKSGQTPSFAQYSSPS